MAKKVKNPHAHQNDALFVSVVERARSGAAGSHGSGVNPKAQLDAKRENTRLARKRRAVEDQLS
jgi:hypothetical protein